MKYNIFVLCGGKSVEHEISLKSASAIINSIDRDKYNVYPVYITNDGRWIGRGLWESKIENPDQLRAGTELSVSESISVFLSELNSVEKPLVFPALHGMNGEDGTIQGFLEVLNIPYVGCNVIASALAMDKAMSKDLFQKHGLPQSKYMVAYKFKWENDKPAILEEIIEKVGYPVYVKPANSGSSVGITRVEDADGIEAAIDLAFKYDGKVVVEEELIAREMQVSVIGNEQPKVSYPGEFIMERPFFDYDAKYIDGNLIPVVPANLTAATMERVQKLALDTYKVLNCSGLTRVDIFVDGDDNIFVNEANTMPGFTPVSFTPVLWKATDGTTYTELVEKLIAYGLEVYEDKQTIVNMR